MLRGAGAGIHGGGGAGGQVARWTDLETKEAWLKGVTAGVSWQGLWGGINGHEETLEVNLGDPGIIVERGCLLGHCCNRDPIHF